MMNYTKKGLQQNVGNHYAAERMTPLQVIYILDDSLAISLSTLIPKFDDPFARQNHYEPPPEFPLFISLYFGSQQVGR